MTQLLTILALVASTPFIFAPGISPEEIESELFSSDEIEIEIEYDNGQEVQMKIDGHHIDENDNDHDEQNHALGLTEVEAEIFTNETVVKVEINDTKSFYTTTTTDRGRLVNEISDHFTISRDDVDRLLILSLEDRASRPKDKN